jgi:Family of unknown function (DUF6174)
MPPRLPALLLILLPVLPGCGVSNALNGRRSDYQRPEFTALAQTVVRAQAAWTAAGIQDYRYDFAQSLEPISLPVVRVTVRHGQVVSTETLTQTPPGNPVTNAGRTFEALFAEAEQTVGSASQGKCRELALSFDSADGHPLDAHFGTAEAGIVDGSGGWAVSNVTRL